MDSESDQNPLESQSIPSVQSPGVFRIAQRPKTQEEPKALFTSSPHAGAPSQYPTVKILGAKPGDDFSQKGPIDQKEQLGTASTSEGVGGSSSTGTGTTPRLSKEGVTKLLSNSLPAVQSANNKEDKFMSCSVQLVGENLGFNDALSEYLSSTNKRYSVIGIVGAQGTGKSTLLSMLAGNDPMDLYRQYVFRPGSREAVESCRYQTSKIWAYVSHKTRTIFLDSQPLNSASLFDEFTKTRRRQTSPLDSFKLESLHLLAFLRRVCDTLIFCFDWFVDLSQIREIMRSELFYLRDDSSNTDGKLNLVLLHHRANQKDFELPYVRERIRIFEGVFENSIFDILGGLTMASLEVPKFSTVDSLMNYIILPEIKPRTKLEGGNFVSDQKVGKGIIDYGSLIAPLRLNILQLPKRLFINSYISSSSSLSENITELEWFSYAGKVWSRIITEVQSATKTTEEYLPFEVLIDPSFRMLGGGTTKTAKQFGRVNRRGIGGGSRKRNPADGIGPSYRLAQHLAHQQQQNDRVTQKSPISASEVHSGSRNTGRGDSSDQKLDSFSESDDSNE